MKTKHCRIFKKVGVALCAGLLIVGTTGCYVPDTPSHPDVTYEQEIIVGPNKNDYPWREGKMVFEGVLVEFPKTVGVFEYLVRGSHHIHMYSKGSDRIRANDGVAPGETICGIVAFTDEYTSRDVTMEFSATNTSNRAVLVQDCVISSFSIFAFYSSDGQYPTWPHIRFPGDLYPGCTYDDVQNALGTPTDEENNRWIYEEDSFTYRITFSPDNTVQGLYVSYPVN